MPVVTAMAGSLCIKKLLNKETLVYVRHCCTGRLLAYQPGKRWRTGLEDFIYKILSRYANQNLWTDINYDLQTSG